MSRSIHGNAFSWPIATSTSSQGSARRGSPVGSELAPAARVALRRDLLEHHAGQPPALVRELDSARGSCGSGFPRASRLPSPTETPSSRRTRSARRPARRLRRAAGSCGSNPSPCCRRPARRRACRSASCGRTTPTTASRCRCGYWPQPRARPGMSRSRPRGAPLPMNTASHIRCIGARAASPANRCAAPPRNSMPPSRM